MEAAKSSSELERKICVTGILFFEMGYVVA